MMFNPYRKWTSGLAVAAVALVFAGGAQAGAAPGQGGGRQLRQGAQGPRAGQRPGGLPAPEVERLFDGYVAMQAQEALQLTDAQFPQFLARLKSLQEARRRNLLERRQVVAELNRSLKAAPVPEAQLRDGLRKLRELQVKNADEVRKAYDAIDEVLDVTQQARFRVFEESVERRKFDLVLRARRAARGGVEDR